MSFVPYSIYEPRLPKLRPGFFMNIAGKFYQISAVRNNRQSVDIGLAYALNAPLILNSQTLNAYEGLHGNLETGRVVQLQYFSLTSLIATLLQWGVNPLLSKWRNVYIDSNGAGLTNPLQIDRWSYHPEMRLGVVKDVGAQTLWLEIVENEVISWDKTPPKKYLKILETGEAVFVEAG